MDLIGGGSRGLGTPSSDMYMSVLNVRYAHIIVCAVNTTRRMGMGREGDLNRVLGDSTAYYHVLPIEVGFPIIGRIKL